MKVKIFEVKKKKKPNMVMVFFRLATTDNTDFIHSFSP